MIADISGRSHPVDEKIKSARIDRRPVFFWLLLIIAVLFCIVLVGGATRLTDSGLSITEWQIVVGVVPPLSDSQWATAFAKYREIPEFSEINSSMTLDAFKFIYWWEWAHRFLARAVGVLVILPMAFFWIAGRLDNWLKPWLVGLVILGGLQGAIGWWMVASGLVERVDVSQYRLAVHLLMACLIIALSVWVCGLVYFSGYERPKNPPTLWPAWILVGLIFFQIFLGALVAGLRAGLTYNEWPTMDGDLIPPGLTDLSPIYLNFFESILTVQFDHRVGAYILIFFGLLLTVITMRDRNATKKQFIRAAVLVASLIFQTLIGILTLLWVVPINVALLHQATAILILMYSVHHVQRLGYGR